MSSTENKNVNINKNNALLCQLRLNATTSFVRHERTLTNKQREEIGNNDISTIVNLFRDEKGKPYPELKELDQIKRKIKSVYEKYCLDVQIAGSRIISIHLLDELEKAIFELKSQFNQQIEVCANKVEEWREKEKEKFSKIENFDNSSLPSAQDFRDFKVEFHKFPLAASFGDIDFSENDALLQRANEERYSNLLEAVNNTLDIVVGFMSGERKSLKKATIDTLRNKVDVLKRNAIVEDAQFDTFADTTMHVVQIIETAGISDRVKDMRAGRSNQTEVNSLNNMKDSFQEFKNQAAAMCEGII